jgi:hypothetical protein
LRSRNSAHHRHAVAEELLDEASVVFALSEGLVVHDRLLEGNRGLESSDHVFVESPRHAFDASGATGGSGNDFGRSVVIQSDGRIVVAGSSNSGDYGSFSLLRLNADGSLDTTFGASVSKSVGLLDKATVFL